MLRISFTERLIDNQPAASAGQIVSIDCHFRRHSRLSKIASLAPRSFDYFSPVCNGVQLRDAEPRRAEKRQESGSPGPRSDNIDETKETRVVCGVDVNCFARNRFRLRRGCLRDYRIDGSVRSAGFLHFGDRLGRPPTSIDRLILNNSICRAREYTEVRVRVAKR